jgi:hypothetical protein
MTEVEIWKPDPLNTDQPILLTEPIAPALFVEALREGGHTPKLAVDELARAMEQHRLAIETAIHEDEDVDDTLSRIDLVFNEAEEEEHKKGKWRRK